MSSIKNRLEVKATNHKKYLAIALLATVLSAGIVFALTAVTSNHLIGTGTVRPLLVLTGYDIETGSNLNNVSGVFFQGDTFSLTANLTHQGVGVDGVLVTFYDGTTAIGTGTTTAGGLTSLQYFMSGLSWDIHAEANVPDNKL